MKKFLSCSVICLLALCFLLNPISVNADTPVSSLDLVGWPYGGVQYILYNVKYKLDTPNTANVVDADYLEFVYPSDRTTVAGMLDATWDALSLGDYRLSSATPEYNCHSYAWRSQSVSTNYFWIGDPSAYYSDGSYYEVATPMAGDIICYFDDAGTTVTSDDVNLHSGIVAYVRPGVTSNGVCGNSNTVVVESKWGSAGLYRHLGSECPYTDYVLSYIPSTPENYIGDYVRYYRRTGHTHNHNTYNDTGDLYYHECVCSCGQVIHDEHNWKSTPITPRTMVSPNYVPMYTCRDCGIQTPMLPA